MFEPYLNAGCFCMLVALLHCDLGCFSRKESVVIKSLRHVLGTVFAAPRAGF